MDVAAAVGTALKEGGPAAGILILFAFLGYFDLPLPGNLPPNAAIIKPVLAMVGALGAYTFLPRRRRTRVPMIGFILLMAVASFAAFQYFNDVPATPRRVTLHLAGATITLGLTYLFLGALLRELIATLLIVFRMQTPRGSAHVGAPPGGSDDVH
jgi:hypothetical protein